MDERKACFLVCDGVAGLPPGGDYAAKLVCDTLLTQLHHSDHFTPESTRAAIEQCQKTLHIAQGSNPNFSRMSNYAVSTVYRPGTAARLVGAGGRL